MHGLLFESGDGRVRFLVEAGGPTVLVGRRPPAEVHNVVLPDDARVSRVHLRITGELILEDLSAGGTFLGGERISGRLALAPGMVIEVNRDLHLTARAFDGAHLADRMPIAIADGNQLLIDVSRRLVALHAAGHAVGHWGLRDVIRAADGRYELLVANRATADVEYLAPDDPLGCAADLYTLGLVYYEALSGRRPHPAPTEIEVMQRRQHGAMPAFEPTWDEGVRYQLFALLDSDARTRITAATFYERLTTPWLD